MSRRDVDVALRLIAQRLPHLRHPRRIDLESLPAHSRVLGQYRLLTDTMRVNARYLAPLDDTQALDLLDTLLHELLHKHASLWRQVHDTFRPHPDIWAEAARLCRELAPSYLAHRSGAALHDAGTLVHREKNAAGNLRA